MDLGTLQAVAAHPPPPPVVVSSRKSNGVLIGIIAGVILGLIGEQCLPPIIYTFSCTVQPLVCFLEMHCTAIMSSAASDYTYTCTYTYRSVYLYVGAYT